jgi:hypothetical protein
MALRTCRRQVWRAHNARHVAPKLLIIGAKTVGEEIVAAAARRGLIARVELVDVESIGGGRLPDEVAADARCIVFADSTTVLAAAPTIANVPADTVLLSFSGMFAAGILAAASQASLLRGRLLGLGTIALSDEFRRRIAARLTVDPRDVHASIIGGEAEAAVPLWSSAIVAGIPLHQWAVMGHGKMTVRDRIDIFLGLKASFADDAYARFANAAACIDIVEAIFSDSSRVLTVGSRVADYRGIPTHGSHCHASSTRKAPSRRWK